jgi:hypothetical protein
MFELCISIKELSKQLKTGTDLIRRYLEEDDFNITEAQYNRIYKFYKSIKHKDRVHEVIDKHRAKEGYIYLAKLNRNRLVYVIGEYNKKGIIIPEDEIRYSTKKAWKEWDKITEVEK